MSAKPTVLAPSLAIYIVTACVSLFLASGSSLWFLAVIVAAIASSYVLRVRLPLAWLPSLLLAGFLLGLAILLTPTGRPTAMIGEVRSTLISGQAAAILALIQFYRPVPRDPSRPALVTLICSTVILLGACSTYDESVMRGLLPAVVLLAGVAIRATRVGRAGGRVAWLSVGGALAVALGLGALGVSKAAQYRDALSEWGNRLIGERPFEMTGMAQQPALGPLFGLRGSPARVLRLEGKFRSSHLRGLSYDTYSEGRWWPIVTARGFRNISPRDLAGAAVPSHRLQHVSVTLLSSDHFYFYAPMNTVSMELTEIERLEWATEMGGPLRGRVSLPYTYSYEEGPENQQGLFSLPALTSREPRVVHLAVPAELKQLLTPQAEQITAAAKSPTAKIAAVTQYLLKNYPYSLRFAPGRGDPVASFLLREPRQGAHCELFASSAALLLRCVGVPTRYVTGYFAHEQQEDGSTLVRQRDAHAWCEAWVDGAGWVLVEATPPTGWPENDSTPIEVWRRAWERAQDLWVGLLGWLAARESWQLVLLAGGPLLLGVVRWAYRRQYQKKEPEPTWLLPPLALQEIASRFELVLRRGGVSLSPTQPWSEQLADLPEALRPRAARFLLLYDAIRFGDGEGESTLVSALEELESGILALTESPPKRLP